MKLKTFYLAKDQRKVKDSYRKRFDKIKWDKQPASHAPKREASSTVELEPTVVTGGVLAFEEHVNKEIRRISGINGTYA